MDMEDDSMEIDESIPATPIIERKSDEFAFPDISASEKDTSIQNTDGDVSENSETPKTIKRKSPINVSEKEIVEPLKKDNAKQDDVVVLDDDDDEPMPTTKGK